MKKTSLRYIISLVVLLSFGVVFTLAGCKANTDKDKEAVGTEGGLQEKDEDDEVDSGDYEDIFSNESEDDKTNVNQEGTTNSNSKDNNGNSSSVMQPKPPAQGDTDQEDKVEDNNKNEDENENDPMTGAEEDLEDGWGPIF